jgi:hypothetical protein
MEIDGRDMRAHKATESYGKTANRILEDLMGLESTRPAKVEKNMASLFDAIEAGKLQAARKLIETLRADIGDDPELTKAAVLIKRKELLGK